ncbi:Phosphatidylinositol 3-/4-kinase, catalytic domain [Dillenia turbinata]|uniref:1-phosphatidylinositol 4-kinase n=1 Tax=Dillenia turbinata TaxID=194707 RepID=A0AAN8UVK0_9MAGN
MVRLLGLNLREDDVPREITKTIPAASEGGENGWLIRFFDSAFFCEWIAVSYLYKHDHAGVRDYLCNRMYTLPLSGIESYLFQICYMMVHKPSPSLDKFVIDLCSKSLKIALKVHWFLLAELEDSDDNEGISRLQDKCQIAATLMGEWPPLIRPQNAPASPGSKNPVLNRLLSSKQRFLSLTSSPPPQKSFSFSPSSGSSSLLDEGGKLPSEENNIFKKFMPGPKMREALLFRKSTEKDDEDSEKDGFFKRLLRDGKDEDEGLTSSSEGFFKRLFHDVKNDQDEKLASKSTEDDEKDGFFKKLFKDRIEEKKDCNDRNDGEGRPSLEEKSTPKSPEDDEKGFFRKLFKDRFEDKKDGSVKHSDENKRHNGADDEGRVSYDEKTCSRSDADDEKGFFRKFFKDKFEDRREGNGKADEDVKGTPNGEDAETSDFSLFRRLFRVHPEDQKIRVINENGNSSGAYESSPGTENFFRKLFKDRDRSVEDSELFGIKKNKEKHPGSPKPPLPNNSFSQFRKGAYHESLDFVQSLCETSYGLVDVFPIEDRRSALLESLAEINSRVAAAQTSGGVCFPMGKGVYRVVHIPEDEAVLLNSREKAPYLICVEVLKSDSPSNVKDASHVQKLSKGGIPLANGDALLPKPPPWAYPLSAGHEMDHSGNDRMSRSASQAIDQAMAHLWEAKVKFVNVSLSVEEQAAVYGEDRTDGSGTKRGNDLEFVSVALTADPGVNMEDIVDQEPPRRKEHRRVPSTIAIEEVKAAAAKGEAPPGLPLKGAGQDSSDGQPKVCNNGAPKASDALSGELWEVKKERIRKASVYGNLPDWDLCSIIVKSGDDCRQEHLAVQLISHFYDIFQEAGLPLWLRPYEVLVTSSYTALIETISDTASIHSIKSRYPNITSLRDFFLAKYGENSPSFKLAQRNFVESMAGYSLVCYLLQVKDRHNGNLLIDEEGHIIHIDFGFMLSNSPGGVNFESAPFKLTRELLEVMDSDAEGVPSEFFDYFKVLCIQGFLTCRKHAERIVLLVEMLQDSGFPCFKGGPRTIQNLRKRFHLSLTEEHCVSLVLSLISSSLDAWRTRQYDYYQRVLNGIL